MAASPDDIFAMIVFARVVQAQSFTGAAARLGVSKSVVSARVAALEARLGTRLLHRTTRKLSLTADGQALVEQCASLLAAADRVAETIASTGDTPRGVLRINAPVVFAEEYLAVPIADYLARFPEVRIEITLADRMVNLVQEGIDVAVRVSSRLEGAGLTARRLANDRTVLVQRRATSRARECRRLWTISPATTAWSIRS